MMPIFLQAAFASNLLLKVTAFVILSGISFWAVSQFNKKMIQNKEKMKSELLKLDQKLQENAISTDEYFYLKKEIQSRYSS